jgi:hypothetical protein
VAGCILGLAVPAVCAGAGWHRLGASLSVDPQGWAFHPTIATGADGTIYAAWTQHTSPSDWQLAGIHAARWRKDTWERLGGRIGHVRGQAGARWASAYAPAMAVVGNTPSLTWYEGGGYGWGKVQGTSISSSVFVAHWDGGGWRLDANEGIPNGALNTAPEAAARTPALAAVEGALHAAWIETRKASGSSGRYNVILVKHLVDGRWLQVGQEIHASPLPADAKVIDLALAAVGGIPHVAWSEWRKAPAPALAQVHVARLTGARWRPLGGPLNLSSAGYAEYLAVAVWRGSLHVAWQERAINGNHRIQVKAWDGQGWVQVGESLNVDPDRGEAGRPALASEGSRLWLAWTEAVPGARAALYTRTFLNGRWTDPTGPLNVAPGEGAADTPALAVRGGRPVIIWAEKERPPATKQVFVRELR